VKYNIILADPPWNFSGAGNRHARNHYDCMKFKDILALPVKDIAAENCALFLWITMPFLNRMNEVLKEWKFKYKTNGFCWVKQEKSGKLSFGNGYYSRANPELCILAVKGNMYQHIKHKNVRELIVAPRREHSRKPDEVRDRIVDLFGDMPRIELFARQTTPGWDAIGNAIDGKDIRESLMDSIKRGFDGN